MSASGVSNEVVLTLSVAGQADFLRSMQASADSVTDLATAVTSANDRIIASNSEVAASFQAGGTTAVAAGGEVDDATTAMTEAVERLGDVVQGMASEVTTSMGELSATMDRTAASVDANTAAMDASFTEVSEGAEAAGASATKAGSSVLGLLSSIRTLALGASIYVAVSSFSKYQQSLALLTTQAGLASSELGGVSAAIDKISSSTQMSKNTLAQGFYNPVSEGFSVPQAATIENYAAKLSQISGAPLTGTEGTSYAISTMLQTFGLRPTNANVAKMTSLLNAGVGAGDLTLSDLLGATSTGFFNISQAYGISPQDAMGMLDFFTSQGVPAEEAATRSRYFLSLLASPSSTAQSYGMALGLTQSTVTSSESELAALGLRTTKMAQLLRQPNGIAQAMALIDKSISGMSPVEQEGIMSKLFGGGRSDATALALAQHVGLLSEFTNRVGTMGTPQRFEQGWATWEKTFHAQEQRFTTDISSMAIAIGQTWAPAVGAFMDVIAPVAHFFADNAIAAKAFAGVLGGAVLLAFTHLLTVVGTQLVSAAEEGWSSLANLVGGVVSLGGDAKGATAKMLGLAGAETTEGDQALLATGKVGAEDVGMLGVGGLRGALGTGMYTLTVATMTVAAAEILKTEFGPEVQKWTEQHPNVPVIGENAVQSETQVLNFHPTKNSPIERMITLFHSIGLAGGGTVGEGFMTNGPRAIVGEGRAAWPEFVIPTDPAYRSNALGLFGQLGARLMASGGSMTAPSALGEQMQQYALMDTVLPPTMSNFASVGSAASLASSQAMLTNVAMAASGLGSAAAVLGSIGGSGASATSSLARSGSIASPEQFAIALLHGLGDQVTQADVTSLMNWEAREGGNWHNTALFNPLNTTYRLSGSTVMGGGNSAGVQAYTSWGQGLQATIATLQNGGYGDILAALAGGKGLGTGPLAGLARWSGGSYSELATGGIIAKSKMKSLPLAAYDTGGYLPEGLSVAYNGTGSPEPVTPSGRLGGTANGQALVVNVQLDRKTIGKAVVRDFRDRMARR